MHELLQLERLSNYSEKSLHAFVSWLPNLFIAIIIVLIGFWLTNITMSLLNKVLLTKKVDRTLRDFLASFISITLKILVLVAAVSMLGVKTTSLIALLGAAGLAIGLALQGSLSNLAGGMLILFFKPFRAGDFIIAQNNQGHVEKIMLFSTLLKTPTNEVIIIPNGALANGIIHNLTAERNRRLDIKISVAYSSDINKVRQAIYEIIGCNAKIQQAPAPEIYVNSYGANTIEMLIRVWTKSVDYWDVNYYLWEESKKAFDKYDIAMPSVPILPKDSYAQERDQKKQT